MLNYWQIVWPNHLQGVFKNDRTFAIKTLLLILQHFKHISWACFLFLLPINMPCGGLTNFHIYHRNLLFPFLFCAIVELVFHQGAGWHSKRVFLRDTNNLILWMVNDLICLKIHLHTNLDHPNIQMAVVRPECSCPVFFYARIAVVITLLLPFPLHGLCSAWLWLSDCLISSVDSSVYFLSNSAITWFLFLNITSTASCY